MAEKHFFEQEKHTNRYLLPYFKKHLPNFEKMKVLEIGCAEAGLIYVLNDLGMNVRGLELLASRVDVAKEKHPHLDIMVGDITDEKLVEKIGDTFDFIIMRETIEHVPNRTAAFKNLSWLLKNDGYIYFTFPPRFSPFAGHQQVGTTVLRRVPYLHLLPEIVIRALGRIFDERQAAIDFIIQNYHEGISIRSFEKYTKQFGFKPIVKELFLVRPIYETRFGSKPKQVPDIPLLREFTALGCECLLQKQAS